MGHDVDIVTPAEPLGSHREHRGVTAAHGDDGSRGRIAVVGRHDAPPLGLSEILLDSDPGIETSESREPRGRQRRRVRGCSAPPAPPRRRGTATRTTWMLRTCRHPTRPPGHRRTPQPGTHVGVRDRNLVQHRPQQGPRLEDGRGEAASEPQEGEPGEGARVAFVVRRQDEADGEDGEEADVGAGERGGTGWVRGAIDEAWARGRPSRISPPPRRRRRRTPWLRTRPCRRPPKMLARRELERLIAERDEAVAALAKERTGSGRSPSETRSIAVRKSPTRDGKRRAQGASRALTGQERREHPGRRHE